MGHAPKIGIIKQSVMGRAVFTDDSPPVNGKYNRMGINTDIMKDLIKGPLQKGGIDGNDGF
jgi:hypothetical protein